MKSQVDPAILAALEEERTAMAGTRRYRQLQLQAGESAQVRFLPVEMGAKKTWFARIGRHWVNKFPVICRKETSPNFGGDPQCTCPICDVLLEFSQSANKETQKLANRMVAFPKMLTYLFVFSITDERRREIKTPASELYIPNEYWFSRESWKEIETIYLQTLQKNPPFGFLDPVSGSDFTISRGLRNDYRHLRDDPQPLEEGKTVDQMLDVIDKAFAKVKQPDTTPLSDDEMEAAAEKIREQLEGGASGARRGRSSRSEVDRDADETPAPSRGRAAESAAPAASEGRRSRGPDAPAASETEPPARRRSVEAPASETPSRSRGAAGIDERELDEQSAPAKPAADEAPPPVRGGGAATPSRRSAPPPPARGARVEEDPEELPLEKHDPAPPAKSETPAAPAVTAPQRELSSRLRTSMTRLGNAAL